MHATNKKREKGTEGNGKRLVRAHRVLGEEGEEAQQLLSECARLKNSRAS